MAVHLQREALSLEGCPGTLSPRGEAPAQMIHPDSKLCKSLSLDPRLT